MSIENPAERTGEIYSPNRGKFSPEGKRMVSSVGRRLWRLFSDILLKLNLFIYYFLKLNRK
ncbi:MAG: hypothetical protein QXN68_05160 [Thermoplasmata archaeon]